MKETALFIHSTGAFSSMWLPYKKLFPENTLFLNPGNLGYPPNPPLKDLEKDLGPKEDAEHILAMLPKEGLVDVFCHSYGGLVALQCAASLGPRLRSLWMYEPVLFGVLEQLDPESLKHTPSHGQLNPELLLDPKNAGTEAWFSHFIDYWNRPGAFLAMPKSYQAVMKDIGFKMFLEVSHVYKDRYASKADFLALFPKITTLAYGEQSPLEIQWLMKTLGQHIPGNHMEVVKDVNHMAPLTRPGPIRGSIRRHLERVKAVEGKA